MEELEHLLAEVEEEVVGFTAKERAARLFTTTRSAQECWEVATKLFSRESFQTREFAVFLLGNIAHTSPEVLSFLKQKVSQDANWRVQEILAKAFDTFCAKTGYQESLPVIVEWLDCDQANVRRSVTEGLRIWTSRGHFRDQPTEAIRLLSNLRTDKSDYVRRSVGNALRDISRKHGPLIEKETASWDLTDRDVKQVFDLAMKFRKSS